MSTPPEVVLARHAADLDDDGHDLHVPPLAVDGDMAYLVVTNVATVGEGASATASGEIGPSVVANLIDENDATAWHPDSGDGGEWAVVDLGATRRIAAWRIVISVNVNEIPTSWTLQHSSDYGATGWTDVDSVSGGAGGDKGYRMLEPAVGNRYWRIISSGSVTYDPAVFTLDLYLAELAATPSTAAGRAGLTGTPAPTTADYLVGTAQAGLSAEIVVGTTPGGELGGTWASPTVDATHSGSTHAATQAAAEATAAAALAAHVAAGGGIDHVHIQNLTFSGDGSTTAFELPAAPFDEFSCLAFVAGLRTAITLSGSMLTTMTFGSAPASGTDNVTVDVVAALA